jgi:hypothetical protein
LLVDNVPVNDIQVIFPLLLPTCLALHVGKIQTQTPAWHTLRHLHFHRDDELLYTSLFKGVISSRTIDGGKIVHAFWYFYFPPNDHKKHASFKE